MMLGLTLNIILLAVCLGSMYRPLRPPGTYGPGPGADMGRPNFFFDLENTLYSPTVSEEATHRWAVEFIVNKIKCPPAHAEALLARSRAKSYPGFISVLVKELGVDEGDFQTYLEERLSNTISPNPKLRDLLGSMNANLYLMSQNGLGMGTGALNGLGISDLFNGVMCPDYNSPTRNRVYYDAMDYIGESNPSNMYYMDDNLAYAKSARMAGWNSFHLNNRMGPSRCPASPGFPSMSSLYDLPRFAPGLF